MRSIALFPAVAALALAACDSGQDTPAPGTTEAETGAVPATATADPSATSSPSPTATMALPTEIPAAFQGRFGLVPDDCTSTRGDAKGLLEVSGDQLKFYESVGKLDKITEATDGRIKADFSFSGEGMEWTRQEVFDLREGGKVLVRREFGEGATPTPFNYTRCG